MAFYRRRTGGYGRRRTFRRYGGGYRYGGMRGRTRNYYPRRRRTFGARRVRFGGRRW